MFRNLRALLSVRRLPLRTETFISQNAGLYNIRRVQLSRPTLFSRFKRNLPYATGAAIVWFVLYPKLMGEEDNTGTQNEAHGEDNDGDTGKPPSHGGIESQTDHNPDENAIFIPLGWARQCEVKPYKGSDPEWQEFVKFSHDPERGMKIRRELAKLVEQACKLNKGFSRRLGDQVVVTKYWLDLDYPDAPPPEYERGGVEITEDYIAWTKRKVTATNYFRLQHVLWPSAAANTCLTTFWAIIYSKYLRLKDLWSKDERNARQANWNPVRDPGQLEKDRAAFEKLRAEMEKNRAEVKRRRAELEKARAENPGNDHADFEKYRAQIEKGSQTSSMQATSSDAKDSPAKQASDPTGEAPSALSKSRRSGLRPAVPPPESNVSEVSVWDFFKSVLEKSWRPPPVIPPRGCIMVSGLVEVVGTRAVCVIDTKAAYNPKTSRFEVVGVVVRRVADRSQAPKGGP